MAVIKWGDYNNAYDKWLEYWRNEGKRAPCSYHKFLGLDENVLTFGKLLKLSVSTDEAAAKISHLCSPHSHAIIRAWCIRNGHST